MVVRVPDQRVPALFFCRSVPLAPFVAIYSEVLNGFTICIRIFASCRRAPLNPGSVFSMHYTKKRNRELKTGTREKKGNQARTLRTVRKIHRVSSIWLFMFLLLVAGSGLLLGWKKNTGDALLPQTRKGSSTTLSEWLPLDSLMNIADATLSSHYPELSRGVSRVDLRPTRGIAKFIYEDHYLGIQLDGKTGEVLHIGKRNSDLIENIHDGSVLDRFLGTNGILKLIYTSVTGISLLMFTLTGIWLWYGRGRLKKSA